MLPFINPPFEYASGLLGASVDELKLIASFLLSYPFAAVVKRLSDDKPYQKNIFIIAVGLFYLVGLFDLWSGIRTLFISSTAAYAIAYYIDGPLMPWIAFVFLMGHMSVNHIIREYIVNDPSLVDITGAQMVMVMKLSGFCWNVHDGRLREEDLVESSQKARAIKKMPGFLDYTGYVLFFPSLMVGPAFDYVEYRQWLDGTMFRLPEGTDPSRTPPTRGRRKIPRSGRPAMIKGAMGLLWLLAFLKLSALYYPGFVLEPQIVKYNFFRRIWILHMICITARTKYYAVWFMAEGACILSGIGYRGVDPKTGKIDWSRVCNVQPLNLEMAQNSREYLASWNINTNNWLRNYVYLRVTPKGKKPGFRASMATFLTSAFWHGFEPGYYLTFVLGAFVQTIAKNFRRHVRPFFMTPDGQKPTTKKPYYNFFSWLTTQLALDFTVTPFILLSFPATNTAWSRLYYYVIVGILSSVAFFSSPGRTMLKKQLAKRNNKRMEMQRTVSIEGNVEKAGQLGVPSDIERDVDELIDEIKQDILERTKRGQSVTEGLQESVNERLGNVSGQLSDTKQAVKDEIEEELKKQR